MPNLPTKAGVGLRLGHIAELAASRPPAAWLELHAENFLANPHAAELLASIAREYPISVHTVGISIGSADGFDRAHLARVGRLVDEINPVLFSGHLAWSTHQGAYLNDLLPVPYDAASLTVAADHIGEVQDKMGRSYLLENPASYFGFADLTMTEPQFLAELVARTGCQLLCDVSNVHLSAHNLGFDARDYIDALPAEAIGEFHLGGFSIEADHADPNNQVVIDTHAEKIAQSAWELYAYAVRRLGRHPTLIEWDHALPPFATLLAEAQQADWLATSEMNRAVAG